MDRVLVLTALADAALDGTSGGRRLHDHLTMPWRVAAGALAAVATRESKAWVAPLLVGAAAAWLGQKAERDCRRELACLGLSPALVCLAEEAAALSLPFVWRRWPALGLANVPLTVGLIIAARARTVSRYIELGEASRRASSWRQPLSPTRGPMPGLSMPKASLGRDAGRNLCVLARDQDLSRVCGPSR